MLHAFFSAELEPRPSFRLEGGGCFYICMCWDSFSTGSTEYGFLYPLMSRDILPATPAASGAQQLETLNS